MNTVGLNIKNKNFLLNYFYNFLKKGYGDITPHNTLEILYSICFIFLACYIFAYSLNSIGIILQEIYKSEEEYRHKYSLMNRYMKKHRINYDLRLRILKYMEFFKEDAQNQQNAESDVVSQLSLNLKEELLIEINGLNIKKMKMFSNNFGEEVLRKLVYCIKTVRFNPGEIIYMVDIF